MWEPGLGPAVHGSYHSPIYRRHLGTDLGTRTTPSLPHLTTKNSLSPQEDAGEEILRND